MTISHGKTIVPMKSRPMKGLSFNEDKLYFPSSKYSYRRWLLVYARERIEWSRDAWMLEYSNRRSRYEFRTNSWSLIPKLMQRKSIVHCATSRLLPIGDSNSMNDPKWSTLSMWTRVSPYIYNNLFFLTEAMTPFDPDNISFSPWGLEMGYRINSLSRQCESSWRL